MVANGNNNMDDPGKGILTNSNGNDERVVNCLVRFWLNILRLFVPFFSVVDHINQ